MPAALIGALLLLAAAPAPAIAEGPPVLVISAQEVLREADAAKAVREREQAARQAFEAEVEEVKRALKAEEEELTRLRGELDPEEFERRTTAFDKRVRAARRQSQKRAAELQRIFREAREKLRSEIAPILIEILKARDADIVLDASSIVVATPSVDITDEVIARFNAEVEPPEIELPGEMGPLPEGPAPGTAPAGGAAPGD